MNSIQPYSLKEYYPWLKKSEMNVPWKRAYLNQEFLKYEQARINKLSKWHKNFLKIDETVVLKEEASFYTIPLELTAT